MSEPLAPPLSTTNNNTLSVDSHVDRRPTNEYPQTPDVLDNNPLHRQGGIRSDYVNSLHRGNPPEHIQQQQQQQQGDQTGPSSSHPLSSPNLGGSAFHHDHQGSIPGPKRVTRAFGLRVIRTVRRGQLPFLLVFFTCVVIFFSALSGLGYKEPNSTPSSQVDEKEFDVGRPVFDGKGMGAEQEEKVERMKRLEQQWAKQKRPKDGAWMKSQRNQREIRRKPLADSRFQRQRQQEEPDLEHQQQQQEKERLDAVEHGEEHERMHEAERDGEDGLGEGDEGVGYEDEELE